MRTMLVEFPYFHKTLGEEVIVEAEVMFYKGIPNAASDWDAQDYLEIISFGVYLDGKSVSVDIPNKVIYSEISSKVRDAEITSAFLEEDGGF